MEIKFHCDSEHNFKSNSGKVRAFLYTDYSIEAHNHDFYEMNIILNGNGTHQIENSCFKVKTGDVFMIPPMTVHAYYDTKNLDVYHILLHKSFISDNQIESANIPGFIQLIEIEPFLRQHLPSAKFLHLSSSQLSQIKSELTFIEENGCFDSEALLPLKYHSTWKILYQLSLLLHSQLNEPKKQPSDKYEAPVIAALEYMHRNYGSKITIDTLCRQVYLSRSTFLRNFHVICGCSPMKYLNEYRCARALEIMENSDFSKTEIAHLCGFYDLSHMERMLKHRIR